MPSPSRTAKQQSKKNNHKAKHSGSEDCRYDNKNHSTQKNSSSRTANQQPKKNNHKTKNSGSEDCRYDNRNHSTQKNSSKLERALAITRSGTSNSNFQSNRFEYSNGTSTMSVRSVRVRNNETVANLKDVRQHMNSIYGSLLVFSKLAGKQFIIKSNSELSPTDSKNIYYIYESKDDDLYLSVHSAHGQEDEPEELVITDLSRMEQTRVFNKQLSNKDSSDLVIYEEELLSETYILEHSLPIHSDQPLQHKSFFPVGSRHSVSEKVDRQADRLRSQIANMLTLLDSTTLMTDKSESENVIKKFTESDEDIKSYSQGIDSSTFLQEYARRILLEKISTESASSKIINFIKAHLLTKAGHLGSKQETDDRESEKLYGASKSEEKKSVSKNQKQPDYSVSKKQKEKSYRRTFQRTRLTYEEIQQRVAVARARVLEQQQKLQYCAVSEEDFERAWKQALLYLPVRSYSSLSDEQGGIWSFSDEEAYSNPQATTPAENLGNIASSCLNDEKVDDHVLDPSDTPYDQENECCQQDQTGCHDPNIREKMGGHVLKPLEQPYDKENELPSGIVEACKKGESLEKCLELWRQVKSEERIIKENDVRLQELEVRKRELNIREKQMSNELPLPSWISEAVSKGECLKDLLELWREKEERQERIQQREEERRIKECDVRLQELEVRKRELDMRKKEMSNEENTEEYVLEPLEEPYDQENEENTEDHVLEPLEEPYDQENGFLPNVEFYRIL